MKKFYIKTKRKSSNPFDEWLTKLEMRAFGWKYKGIDVKYFNEFDLDINWEKETATLKQRFNVYTTFKRISPYTNNILFIFLEFIMSIQSWIRRKLIFLFFGLVVIGLAIGTIESFLRGYMVEILPTCFWIVFAIYVPSIVTLILGFITRKIFFIDSKLKKRLEKNGYKREQNL